MTSPSVREMRPSFSALFFSRSVMSDLSQSHWESRFSSSIAADAAGRGAAGGFPPAAAAELEDPLVELPFFTMVAVVRSFSASGGDVELSFSVGRRRKKVMEAGANERVREKNS